MIHLRSGPPPVPRSRWLLPALLALGLAACSLGPRYSRPDVVAPARWSQPSAPAAWPSSQWWQGFGSPGLNSLMSQALSANDDIAAAIAQVQAADAQARSAGAPLLPDVDAGFSATHERQPVSGAGFKTYSVFNPLLSASYALDFWGRNRALRDAATAAAAASRYDRATVELTVMTAVASSYFQALQLRDRIDIASRNLANAETTLRDLQIEQRIGTATALDVAQQDTLVATLSATLPPLQEQLRQTMDALAILTGQSPEAASMAYGSLAELAIPAVAPGLPAELLARRPDVAQAEAELMAANANIRAARAAFFPSIELTANGGYESAGLATALSPANRVFALSAGVTQPIFQGGALTGQYEYSKAQYAVLLAAYHKAVISAFGNVEDALAAVQQTSDQQQRQQATADKAQHAYDLADAQFHAGTVNILTVLNTESSLFTAQDALAQVKLSHLQAVLQLFAALGGGWQQSGTDAGQVSLAGPAH